MENKIIKTYCTLLLSFRGKNLVLQSKVALLILLQGTIVFEKEYSNMEIIKGLEEFDYLWMIWGFSANKEEFHGTTVRPPLLGGNVRMGVFCNSFAFSS